MSKIYVSDESRKNYAVRVENVLVCSWNTIYFSELPILQFTNECADINQHELVSLYVLISRMNILGDIPDVTDEETYCRVVKAVYPDAFSSLQHTELYGILEGHRFQAIKSMYIAHSSFGGLIDTSKMLVDEIPLVRFDGSVSDLEQIIKELSITAVVIDDIEYLYQLIIRGNIQLEGMSFILSMLGYNFIKTESGEMQYKYQEIIEPLMIAFEFEIAFAYLCKFDIDQLNAALVSTARMNNGKLLGGNTNE